MSSLDEYATKYKTVRMERRNGVLQVTLHTDGQSLRWGFLPHGELPEAFHDIGTDRENRVVILTGTGSEFSGPRATPGTSSFPARPSIERIDRIHWEGRHLLMNLLNIEVPVISAINGPAWRHSEIPLLADIPFVGPILGLVFVWASTRWTVREKLIASAIVIALLLLPLLAILGLGTPQPGCVCG